MAGQPDADLFLLRHGRTGLNAGGRLRGRLDVPLDRVGLTEAERLGETFRETGLALIVSSPLQRAVATARAVAYRRGIGVEIDDGLADRDWGPWAGRPESEVTAMFGSPDEASGVEPLDQFRSRILEAVHRLASRAEGAPVMAVAHDAVNRALLDELQVGGGDPWSIPQRTGCWNLVRCRSGRWTALVIDAMPGDDHDPADYDGPSR